MSYYDEDNDALDEDDLWDPWDDDDEDDDWDALDEDYDEDEDEDDTEDDDMHDVPETIDTRIDENARAKFRKQVEREIAKGKFDTVIKMGDKFFSPASIARRKKVVRINGNHRIGARDDKYSWSDYIRPVKGFTHYVIKDQYGNNFAFTAAAFKQAKRVRMFRMFTRLRNVTGRDEVILYSDGLCVIGCKTHVKLDGWLKGAGDGHFSDPNRKAAAVHAFTILRDKILPKLKGKSATKRPRRGKSPRQSTLNR